MSVGETYLTVLGWVGSEVQFKEVRGQTARASFRVGSTPRYQNRAQGTWVDRPTTWFNVECWRGLAQNVFDSVRIGQPIVVTGRLRTHEWTDASGEHCSRVVLEAFSVGHDLTRGTTAFTKNPSRPDTTRPLPDHPHPGPGPGSAADAEVTTSPYPADEYSATPIPLTPTPRESEAA